MADIERALAASSDAIHQLILAGERTGAAWISSRAPGKWSPSQIVEHVARSLEESANMAAGRPSKFPKLPAVVHPVARSLLFKRVLRKAAFPRAKRDTHMSTERLIDTLAHDVAPAPPLAGPWTRSTVWLLGTLVYFGVLLLMKMSVPEVAANARDWLFTFQQLAAVLMAATAAGAAFALTVPGYPRWSLRLATVTALVWLASVSLGAIQEWTRTEVNLVAPGEWACVAFMVLGGALPALGDGIPAPESCAACARAHYRTGSPRDYSARERRSLHLASTPE